MTAALAAFLLHAHALPASQQDSEWSKRDTWQRPAEVMDALGIHPGSVVADVGCGNGYFVLHLARRVGANGIVYGVDIDEEAIGKLRDRVEQERLDNVHVIHGQNDNPLLPAAAGDTGLDAVLIVNAYHEMDKFDAMLRAIHAALRTSGRLAIIDAPGKNDASRAQHRKDHTISEQLVLEDAARSGFRLRSRERGFDRPDSSRGVWFFLIFEKP